MNDISLLPVFMIGLLGSVHCIGMCGGIVSAFASTSRPVRNFPVAVITVPAVTELLARPLVFNAGRIGSYMVAGALAGGVFGGARTLSGLASLQVAGYWMANLMLVLLGLHLMNAWRAMALVEQLGQPLWRRVQPLTARLLPLDSGFKTFGFGALWGWLPCGMVYSVLLTAMLSGSAASGAAVMLAFGLGTLPTLLMASAFGGRLTATARSRRARVTVGLLVLAFGMLGLLRAMRGVSSGWLDAFCMTAGLA